MSGISVRRSFASIAVLLIAGLAVTTAHAQTGTITGRVTSASATAVQLEGARVTIVGSNLGASSNREGVYNIRGVAAGTHTVRAIRLGYAQREQTVTVTAGQSVTLDFALSEAPFTLEEITITATGEARKLEVGNVINTIQVGALVEQGPIRDVSQILAARAPGVAVLPASGTIGSSSRIRIRGSNSVSLSNEPLFVIDGVRINSDNADQTFGVGGQGASRLLDINPEEIADIQILKGPSASAIYGTGSSNGVVLITTKRGVAGRTRWNFWSETGVNNDNADYPTNYFGSRVATAPTNADRCRLFQQAAGTCDVVEVFTFSPMTVDSTSPLATGRRHQLGGSVSGGTDQVQYFVSGEWEGDQGVYSMPMLERTRLLDESGRSALRTEEIIPNWRSKWNFRANTNFIVNPKVTGAVNLGYVLSDLRLPQDDNNVLGIHSSGINGDGRGGLEEARQWGFFRPGDTFQRLTQQRVDRLTASAHGNWNPLTWLSTRGTVGLDVTQRQDQQLQRFGEGADFGTAREGTVGEGRVKQALYTVDVGGTANHSLSDRLTSKTSAGFQYSENNTHGTTASGNFLPPGAVTVSDASEPNASEFTTITKTAGGYVEQVFGLDDRLFVTGSMRFDKNSSTGFEAKTIAYPKAAVSYVTPWFNSGTISSLRLRGSYGEAGQQPVNTVALLLFGATSGVLDGNDVPGVTLSNFGDPLLKAERSREYEAGFDVELFDGKYQFEFTGYSKDTKDALISITTPPSLGSPGGQFKNAGQVRNQGLELVLNGQVVNTQNVTWDFTLTGSLERNQLQELPEDFPPINANGATQQHRACLTEGDAAGTCYPLGGYWARQYTFEDANSDGIIVASEVMLNADSLEFVGPALPTRQMTFNTVVGLFRNRVQLSTTLDFRGGNYLWNLQEEFRCASQGNCEALYVEGTPLEEQAAVVARTQLGALNTNFGYIEKADFAKWREVSVTYNAPSSWANLLRAERLSLTATGRNLAVFTGYSGLDPEVNGQGTANFAQREFLSVPALRQFAFRVNLTF